MRGKRYGQLMIFSDIAATMTPPPFAIFCIDADVLTGWKDVDAMITTMEGTLLVHHLPLLLNVHVCSTLKADKTTVPFCQLLAATYFPVYACRQPKGWWHSWQHWYQQLPHGQPSDLLSSESPHTFDDPMCIAAVSLPFL